MGITKMGMGRLMGLLIFLIFSVSCSQNKDGAKIHFQLPEQQGSQSEKLGALSLDSVYQWGLQDFSDMTGVSCYAVMLKKNLESHPHKKKCQKLNGDLVAEIDEVLGLYASGQRVELEVEAGLNQEIYLVGLGSSGKCDERSFIEGFRYSSPQILAQEAIDLKPGDEAVVEMQISIDQSKKFQDCDGLFLGTPSDQLLALSVSDASVLESSGGVTINLSHPAPKNMTIDWQISHESDADGLASTAESTDFVALIGTVAVPEGATSVVVPVILNDGVHEDDQSFHFNINGASAGYIATADSQAQITIENDEAVPVVQFAAATSTVFENIPSAGIVLELSHASELPVNVATAAVDITAVNGGSDYTYSSLSVDIAPNLLSFTIPFSVTNSPAIESSETARMDITCAGDCSVGAIGSHTFTITDVP